MLKILSIGNSFSQNAQTYLYGICESEGLEIHNVNLYIGGCSFERHYNNMISGEVAYSYEIHGVRTNTELVSLEDGLMRERWDIITVQEVSVRSFDVTQYEPYMSELVKYVREKQPQAKIYLHMTWGYATESPRMERYGFASQREMYEKIKVAYIEAKRIIGADGIIPSGEVMQKLAELGYKVHSDMHHADDGAANYALGLLWMKALFGKSPVGNGYRAFNVEVSEKEVLAAQKVVDETEALI